MYRIIGLIIMCWFQTALSQQDSLINYNIESQQIYHYALAVIDSSRNFDHTEWNYGNNTESVLLSVVATEGFILTLTKSTQLVIGVNRILFRKRRFFNLHSLILNGERDES